MANIFERVIIGNMRTLPPPTVRRFYVEQQPLRTTSAYEQLRANWAECVRFGGGELVAPQCAEELAAAVRGAQRCRVVGSGHSFSAIVDAPDDARRRGDSSGGDGDGGGGGDGGGNTLISLAHLSHVHGIDADKMTVTVDCGATLGSLCRYLAQRGAALSNLPSFPQLTVGGALATATHGSGRQHRNLASHVAALELVVADGTVRRFERGGGGCGGSGGGAIPLLNWLSCGAAPHARHPEVEGASPPSARHPLTYCHACITYHFT